MNKLPKKWLYKKLGDVVENLDYKRIPLNTENRITRKGKYPYYGASGIIDYLDEFIFEGENLLISEDGANLIARTYPIAFIADGKYWVNNHAHVVNAIPSLTTNKYLEYYFSSIKIDEYVTGSAQPKLNQKNLNSILIPLPPLPEQTHIVSKLDALFARIDKSIALLEENIKHTQALMASVLEEVFKITPKRISISQLVEKTENINPLSNPVSEYTYIDISSINNNLYSIDDPKTLLGKDAPSRAKKAIRINDIVFATTRPNLKNIAIVEKEYTNPVASTGFCILRANKNKARTEFLFLCLLSNSIQDQIAPKIRGAQYPAISDKDLVQCQIPDISLEEQSEISDRIFNLRKKLSNIISKQQSKLQYLKALKASLLDRAFKGEL